MAVPKKKTSRSRSRSRRSSWNKSILKHIHMALSIGKSLNLSSRVKFIL